MFWNNKKDKKNSSNKDDSLAIIAPARGKIIAIEEVKDEAFSEKMMGEGFAVIPEDGIFKAPITGEITFIFPTGTAYGLVDDDGNDVLVHIGIDTVKLKGEGFHALKSAGDKVTQGDPIVEVDLVSVKTAGYDITTPVILTNTEKEYVVTIDSNSVTVKIA